MEYIGSEVIAQVLNQSAERRVEQSSQESERAIEVVQLSLEEEAMLTAALESEHQEIPENSQTITVDETTSRFSGAIWYEEIQKQIVTLAGLGGIGGYVGFLLGRLKPRRLIIYDSDRVETVNM